MKNLLITGGAGFIGSHLVERLLSQGVEHITGGRHLYRASAYRAVMKSMFAM